MSFPYSGHQGLHAGDNSNSSYDFQDTYEGLGDTEDDALNSETFGVGKIGKDFDFGHPVHSQSEPHITNPQVSYARAAANDDDFMKDLWGMPAHNKNITTKADKQEKKFLSLEEIEALLSQGPVPSHESYGPPPQQFYGGGFPQAPYGSYMIPQGFAPPGPHFGMPGAPPFVNVQNPNGFVIGQRQSFPVTVSGNDPQNRGQTGQPVINSSQPQMFAPEKQTLRESYSTSVAPQQSNPSPMAEVGPSVGEIPGKSDNMGEFPILGAHHNLSKRQDKQELQHDHSTPDLQRDQNSSNSDEQQSFMARRQEKVARIMRYSGVMNPKDKDFVTRFQLSQIVTDDPYNEDFYAQVYRVIHPKSTPGALAPTHGQQEPNLIAQAYLDQSGHRLGGRFKRADVALQRMQQQVQKAVSVAKERQSLPHNEREGVLGKISVGSGKKPRQQLTILSKAAQRAKDVHKAPRDTSAEESICVKSVSKRVKKYTRKDIMAILEEIINNLMAAESDSRSNPNVDTSSLWNSLHVLDSSSSSGDDELFVNPFIQCLNFEKLLKILPRLFKFLSRQQTLTIVTLVMSNLENLNVIKEGSYTIYNNKTVPPKIMRLVDLYSLTFCKILMNAVQDFKFHEIIGLLVILIQHNVVSFVSTTKIGLSVITSLISRAELIRGEGAISATDLSEWTSCYDELFTALESRIAAIFPPLHSDSQNDYVWQFLATLSLGGKLSHQRIIVDEVRDEIFGVMNRAKAISNSDMDKLHEKQSMLNNLNMYLVVMGLVANENEISELQS